MVLRVFKQMLSILSFEQEKTCKTEHETDLLCYRVNTRQYNCWSFDEMLSEKDLVWSYFKSLIDPLIHSIMFSKCLVKLDPPKLGLYPTNFYYFFLYKQSGQVWYGTDIKDIHNLNTLFTYAYICAFKKA